MTGEASMPLTGAGAEHDDSADSTRRAVRVTVLGPLGLRIGEQDRTPSAPMARRVLAVLLLHANRPVSVSALIRELWEDEPPRLARKTVQTYIYQLRRAFQDASPDLGAPGEGRLETLPGGYLLRLAADELDLWEFEAQVSRARAVLGGGQAAEAAAMLRTALGLWRGESLTDVEPGPLLAARLPQVNDGWLSAVELRIEAELRLGHHRDLVGELRQLAARHPLHERFTAQLMLAAHRSGQRSAALDAFTRLRRALVEELGMEPSDQLRRLQQDILNDSPGLAGATASGEPAPAPVPVLVPVAGPPVEQLPPDTADFTGRVAELAELVRLLEQGSGSLPAAPRVVTVLGGPGTGKTALALRAAHELRERWPGGQLHHWLPPSAYEASRRVPGTSRMTTSAARVTIGI
ncbi:BTAD domain-containing putative transcriptional regulator, partial [Kitasatospora sp. NPDC093558]|uniref:AfsR/SARP family transcriptional regulator n=1 Tax=Kitasatospora sp. NPDC093558 TaxID=3155201 RepID=UPI003414D768